VAFSFIAVATFEALGQLVIFRDKLYFVNDVDHRMKPHHRLDINSDGIRCTLEADQFREQDLNIIMLGDSFIYGYDLNYEDTIPSQMQVLARNNHPGQHINIVNFAWVSSSPLLSYRLLKDIGDKYQPDLVILGLDMTDFHDDIKYSQLIRRQGVHRLVSVIPITFLASKKVLASVTVFEGLHEGAFG
jgi:hypothetical protein